LKAKNENSAFASLCKAAQVEAQRACEDDEDQVLKAIYANSGSPEKQNKAKKMYGDLMADNSERDKELKNFEKCHLHQAAINSQELQESLAVANEATGDSRWRTNCIPTNIAGSATEQCILFNDALSEGSIISGKDRDNLPVEAVYLGGCTGYTDTSGNMTTAAHCNHGENVTSSERYGANGEKQVGLWRDPEGEKLGFYASGADKALTPYDDASKFKKIDDLTDSSFNGKPYYTLSRDPAMTSGCEVRDNELACSESALREIQGTQATVQGYPATYFHKDSQFNPATDQLVTRGPAYYDSYSGNVRVNAYGSQGNSGGTLIPHERFAKIEADYWAMIDERQLRNKMRISR
jgi:hypothetical protein